MRRIGAGALESWCFLTYSEQRTDGCWLLMMCCPAAAAAAAAACSGVMMSGVIMSGSDEKDWCRSSAFLPLLSYLTQNYSELMAAG
jgi:hypothetical protein